MILTIDPKVKSDFPELHVLVRFIDNVTVRKTASQLEDFKEEINREARVRYDIESLKDEPILRAYRDFFWRIKVDPTKNRPAAEALIRRIISGNSLPRINTLVDAYNLASVQTQVAIAAFDADLIRGKLTMRYAGRGETFIEIGVTKPLTLQGGEIIITDEEKMVAMYPYRDAEESKVTDNTRNILLMFCGVPEISLDKLREAMMVTTDLITRFCGGTTREDEKRLSMN